MRHLRLALLGGAAFLSVLVLHAPAALLLRTPADGAFQFAGVEGTLAAGRVGAVLAGARPVLSDLHWTLRPWWLPLLRLTVDVEAGGDTPLHARVSRALFGRLRLSDIEAAATAKSLLALLGQPALPVEGQARLSLSTLKFDKGLPVEARGTAQVHDLAWALAREPLKLGDFTATLDTDDRGVHVVIGSGPGPLEAGGELRLSPDRTYDTHLQLRPRADAGQQLRALLQSLGAPDAQGWYHVRRQGALP
ncbi:MAG TPA: type II secretion system protein N [Candidatus Binatia bacterium]|nr:type II secretion system protein N [Candidatus Binatia bacterium]